MPSFEFPCSFFSVSSGYARVIFSELPTYQEHYGCVHVEVLEVEAEQADASTKWPSVCEVIINPEGQGEDVCQVSNWQVYHEDHCLGLLTVEQRAEELAVPRINLIFMCLCLDLCVCVPNISAEDPECSGIEQQSWDE